MSTNDPIEATLEAADRAARDFDGAPPTPGKLNGAGWKYAFKRAVKQFGANGGTDLAAMLTYFMVLSLAPALLAIFSIITLVLANNADTVTSLVEDLVVEFVPSDYQSLVTNMVDTMISSSSGGVIALIIGIATALWSASAYVKAFARCMNTVYGVDEGRKFVRQILTMLAVTLAELLGIVLILVSLALNQSLVTGVLGPIAEPLGLGGTLTFLTESFLPIWAWAKWPVILVIIIGLIALLYLVTPNIRKPRSGWLSIGSVLAIVGIAVAGVAMSIYLSQFAGYSSYGVIGTVMALLFVLWVFNIVLLLGAHVDAEVARARQLLAGVPSEVAIQLPPVDVAGVQKSKKARDELESEGRVLRLTYGENRSTARQD
ncbi:YihY/virulence factor BrkB family protein [Citricoccus nitrophenolicus]|uniref:YihY/virulence factor BrkB family protein n=1 Tax=Citricoccus nitrophenolicus TaxID=863575 RepID=UPI0031E7397F